MIVIVMPSQDETLKKYDWDVLPAPQRSLKQNLKCCSKPSYQNDIGNAGEVVKRCANCGKYR